PRALQATKAKDGDRHRLCKPASAPLGRRAAHLSPTPSLRRSRRAWRRWARSLHPEAEVVRAEEAGGEGREGDIPRPQYSRGGGGDRPRPQLGGGGADQAGGVAVVETEGVARQEAGHALGHLGQAGHGARQLGGPVELDGAGAGADDAPAVVDVEAPLSVAVA